MHDNNNTTSDNQFKMKRKRKSSKNQECNSDTIISNGDNGDNGDIYNSFQESLEELANLLNISKDNKEKDVTHKSQQEEKRKRIKKSLQKSVIIINDSESESSDKDTADNSVCIVEHIPNTSKASSSPLFRRRKKQLRSTLKRRTRSSVTLLDDNPSSASSNIQKSLEERDINRKITIPENKEAEDDVVELWSCTNKPSSTSEDTSEEYKNSQTEENAFVIDKRPDTRNLDYISINTSPVYKRQRTWRYHNKDSPTKKCDMHISWKLLNKQQKMKTYNQSCTHISKNQDKKSKKENSNRKHELREIIIDGCNVAMTHTNGREFSEKGIKLMVDYFESRGHIVKVFLPQHVRRKEYKVLEELYRKGIVVFTPSRNIAGKQITPYDDRYILEYATKCGGIVISSDQYRDLYRENPEWRDTILNRLLTPTFVGDYIMFPVDPLGKSGPDLETFLKH